MWNASPQPTGWVPVAGITLTGNSYHFSKEFDKYASDPTSSREGRSNFLQIGSLKFEILVDKIANYHRSGLHPIHRKKLPAGITRETMIRNMAVVLYSSEIATHNAWNVRKRVLGSFDTLPYFDKLTFQQEAEQFL